MDFMRRISQWHQTKTGLAAFGVGELLLAYVFISWAIDRGSLIDWFCALILIIGALQNLTKLVMKVVRPDGQR